MNNKIIELASAGKLPEVIPCKKHAGVYTEIHGDNGDTVLLMRCSMGHYFYYEVSL